MLSIKKTVVVIFLVCSIAIPAQAKFKFSDIGDKVTLDAEMRVRPEFRKDLSSTVPAVPGSAEEDFSVLLRSRLGLMFSPTENVDFYIQAQDARDFGEEVAAGTGIAADDEGLDIHQGYIDYSNMGHSDFSFRLGRQEIILGDQRLVGAVGWSNTGRSFDGGVLTFDNDHLWLSLIGAMTNKTLAGDQQWFGGLYGSWKEFPNGVLDVYYLALHDNDGAAGSAAAGTGDTQSVHTFGSRIKVEIDNTDFGVEGAAQLGKFGSNSIFAYAGHAKAGYTWKNTALKPRVGFEGNYASGDTTGGRYTRFNNLSGTEHDKYGLIDAAVWSNLIDGSGGVSISPENWTASLDYHLLMVANESDAFGFGGVAGAAGRRDLAGHEIDTTVGHTLNDYAKLLLGYSILIPGGFLRDAGVTTTSHLGYLQATASF